MLEILRKREALIFQMLTNVKYLISIIRTRLIMRRIYDKLKLVAERVVAWCVLETFILFSFIFSPFISFLSRFKKIYIVLIILQMFLYKISQRKLNCGVNIQMDILVQCSMYSSKGTALK